MSNNEFSRRQFLKISSGAIGAAVAGESVSLGADTRGLHKAAQQIPVKTGKQVPSVCPYCAVGCGQIVTVSEEGKIIDIQGHPDSPINQGTLCPKGAATYQLVNNDLRWTKVLYRAPGSDCWTEKPLDWAMERIAKLARQTRDTNFNIEQDVPAPPREALRSGDGNGGMVKKRVMNTYAIASLGGATMDNEWNYAHQKLMHALGVVYLENQARI